MHSYVVLLRGINVGGKNRIPMAELRAHLTDAGFHDVASYIASGNVVLRSTLSAAKVARAVEQLLVEHFPLDVDLVRVLVLTHAQLRAVVDGAPAGFGEQPDTYHSDAIFLIDVSAADAMAAFSPREGVDEVTAGEGVIYSQRVSAKRTKSRLNKVLASPLYTSMTIRNWRTTTRLLAMLDERADA